MGAGGCGGCRWGQFGLSRPPHAPPSPAGRCLIQVLTPMPTRGLGPEAVPALTESVRQTMLEAFDRLSGELSPGQDPHTPQ